MKWIKHFFKNEIRNYSYFEKIKKHLKEESSLYPYDVIIYLGGFEFDNQNLDFFKESIKNGEESLKQFLDKVKYNINKDNIELYLIWNFTVNKKKLVVLLDYFELFEPEEILDIFEFKSFNYEEFNYKLIYGSLQN